MQRNSQTTVLDSERVREVYARWAPVYDLAFAAPMRRGRHAAAAAASQAAERAAGRGAEASSRPLVLDVGVGTGLELPMFRASALVVGIDLSEPMLRRAKMRVQARELGHVAGLLLMDATRLGFADATFDAAVAPFVMTVVPEPQRALDELARVVKPGGEVILVNHISPGAGPVARVETWLARRSATLGWRPEFAWETIGDWIARRRDVRLIERRRLPPFGLFTLVRLGIAGASPSS